MFCAQISSNMQRIIQILDVITIFSSLSFLAYCASDFEYSWLTLYDVTSLVPFLLAIIIRICRFADQRWQLVADRLVMSTLVIFPLYEKFFEGSEDDLSLYLFTVVLNSSIILVRGRLFRVLLSVPILPMFIGAALYIPDAPVCILTSAVGCIWREHLTTPHIQI